MYTSLSVSLSVSLSLSLFLSVFVLIMLFSRVYIYLFILDFPSNSKLIYLPTAIVMVSKMPYFKLLKEALSG